MALVEARHCVDDLWTEGEFIGKANAYFCEIGLQSPERAPESISALIKLKRTVDDKLSWICLLCNISEANEDVMRLVSLSKRNNPILSITKHFSGHHCKVVHANLPRVGTSSSVSSAAVAIENTNSGGIVEVVGEDMNISKSSKQT